MAKLFAHLLANDAISWGVLGCIRLTEEDTTSSSRIFIKYLFQVGLGGDRDLGFLQQCGAAVWGRLQVCAEQRKGGGGQHTGKP